MPALLLLTLACANKSPEATEDPVEVPAPDPELPGPGTPTAPEIETPAAPAPPEPGSAEGNPAEGNAVVSTWLSESCGSREYARELTLNPDMSWTARDLVSPCPAGATCVWSGIINSSGTWTTEGLVIHLQETAKDGDQGAPRPTSGRVRQDGRFATQGGDGTDEACVYERG